MHSMPPLVTVSSSHSGRRPCVATTRSIRYSRTLGMPSLAVYWSAMPGSSRTSRAAMSSSSSVANVAGFGKPPVIPSAPGGGPARIKASSPSAGRRARRASISCQSMTCIVPWGDPVHPLGR